MMVLELVFDVENSEERLAARPAHRELLGRLQADGALLASGPWPDDSGAMLIFRTDRAGLDEIIAADPYYAAAGVTISSIREWHPIAGTATVSA